MYLKAPMLCASLTPRGKELHARLEQILENKKKKAGLILPLAALILLLCGTLVACTVADATPEAQPPIPAKTETVAYSSPLKETKIIAPYGRRTHPVTGVEALHAGVDLQAEVGTPVLAAADGTVRKAGYTDVYGNSVLLTHENGQESFYGHMETLLVADGETVEAGQQIGTSGQTGMATGPHLHFEILEDGIALDPTDVVS